MTSRVGFGFDVHKFSDDPERALVLGGVHIDGHRGLEGHSDADVVVHAIIDSLLGAAGLGDIGDHFSDTDEQWKGVDSMTMLQSTLDMVKAQGFMVGNVDCTIVTERPRIAPHRLAMQDRVSALLGAPLNVKASRAEGLGAIGRIEGAACWAVAMLSVGVTK